MTQPVPVPLPEPAEPSLGLCADEPTARELQSLCDAEHGYPKKCFCHDGSEPPPGVPRTILHAVDPEPVEHDAQGRPTSWAHPLPRAELRPPLSARVQRKTRAEIADLKAQNPPLPDVATEHNPVR